MKKIISTITHKDLTTILYALDGFRKIKIEIVTVTDPRMKKTGNPFIGTMKHTRATAYINFDYQNEVNKARKKENKNNDFITADRVWGEHVVKNGCVIEHPGKEPKLEVMGIKVKSLQFIFDNKNIDKSLLTPFLPSKTEGARQELENPVVVRTYNFSSIKEITIGKKTYKII